MGEEKDISGPYVEREWRMLRLHARVAAGSFLPVLPLVLTDHWKLGLLLPVIGLGTFEVFCRLQRTHGIYRLYGQATTIREMSEWSAEKVRDYFSDWEEQRPTSRFARWWIQNITHGGRSMSGHGGRADRNKAGSVLVRTRNLRRNSQKDILESMRSVRIGSQSGGPSVETGAFRQSGMAIPSITRQATAAMARGAAGLCMIGTGEGGLWPEHLAGGEHAQVEFQIGTGYFGCRNDDGTFSLEKLLALMDSPSGWAIRAVQVKLSQGAKQTGGKAPGWKMDAEVARYRGIEIGKDCNSPGTHSAFDGADGLAQFVSLLRKRTGRVIGVKMAVGSFAEFDDMCAAWVANPEGIPDYVQIDGGEGGTGAASEEEMKCAAMPAATAIQVADLLLRKHGLRERVRIVGSAGGFTPEDLVRMYALGSDIVATGRGFKYAVGCIGAAKCHIGRQATVTDKAVAWLGQRKVGTLGECPTGVAANGYVIDPVERGAWVRTYVQAMYERTATLLSLTGVESLGDFVGSRKRYLDMVGVDIWTIRQVEEIIAAERG